MVPADAKPSCSLLAIRRHPSSLPSHRCQRAASTIQQRRWWWKRRVRIAGRVWHCRESQAVMPPSPPALGEQRPQPVPHVRPAHAAALICTTDRQRKADAMTMAARLQHSAGQTIWEGHSSRQPGPHLAAAAARPPLADARRAGGVPAGSAAGRRRAWHRGRGRERLPGRARAAPRQCGSPPGQRG